MENIGDLFTPEGLKKITVGQTLSFVLDGEKNSYKVVRRHIKRQELWVRPVKLYRPDEVHVVDKVD